MSCTSSPSSIKHHRASGTPHFLQINLIRHHILQFCTIYEFYALSCVNKHIHEIMWDSHPEWKCVVMNEMGAPVQCSWPSGSEDDPPYDKAMEIGYQIYDMRENSGTCLGNSELNMPEEEYNAMLNLNHKAPELRYLTHGSLEVLRRVGRLLLFARELNWARDRILSSEDCDSKCATVESVSALLTDALNINLQVTFDEGVVYLNGIEVKNVRMQWEMVRDIPVIELREHATINEPTWDVKRVENLRLLTIEQTRKPADEYEEWTRISYFFHNTVPLYVRLEVGEDNLPLYKGISCRSFAGDPPEDSIEREVLIHVAEYMRYGTTELDALDVGEDPSEEDLCEDSDSEEDSD